MGANLCELNSHNQTPLHTAACSLHSTSILIQLFTLLLEISPHSVLQTALLLMDNDGNNVFHLLVSQPHPFLFLSVLIRLFDVIEEPFIDVRNQQGKTLLHLAAEVGDWRLLEILLLYNPTLNLGDIHHNTPLHCATYAHNWKSVHSLLRAGANIELVNKKGASVTRVACESGDDTIIGLLEAFSDFENLFIETQTYNPPIAKRCSLDFYAENQNHTTVSKGDIVFLYFEHVFGWCFVETLKQKSGSIPGRCLTQWYHEGSIIRELPSLDYLREDPNSLLYALEQNGEKF
jgi:hypothetical protein